MYKEQIPSFEKKDKISQRDELTALEKEGNFLFHGSPNLIESLGPRQAYAFDKEKQISEPDGEPAISASQFADVAIFMSIVNAKNFSISRAFSLDENNKLSFSTTKEGLELTKDNVGYIYVFKKDDFEKFSDMEYRAKKEIKPEKIIPVYYNDLPKNIKVIEHL